MLISLSSEVGKEDPPADSHDCIAVTIWNWKKSLEWFAPVPTGWVRYYGRFYPSKLQEDLRTIGAFIVRWATRKYKRF